MKGLNDVQKDFIERFHTELKPREMAAKLGVTVDKVREYMGTKAFPSICSKAPKFVLPLTDHDKKFIRENCQNMTINKMKDLTGKTYIQVQKYVKEQGLKVKTGRKMNDREAYIAPQIVRISSPSVVKFQRPPAVYSNTDWKKYGDEILKRKV